VLLKALSALPATVASNEAVAVHAHTAKLGLDRERTVRNEVIALYLTRGNRAAAGVLFYGFPDVVS
jgi:1-aminocyclopropane-1-carboxylate deaminase/D-cysteine desulfhydrase-like pyridoxal-dependent ACC family enzyme